MTPTTAVDQTDPPLDPLLSAKIKVTACVNKSYPGRRAKSSLEVPFKRADTHCHHLCSFPVASQDIVKCKSQLLDNGDGADLFHSSFILRAGGGGGGVGGGGAGFAGAITESRWIIQYSHRSECVSTDEPKRSLES